MLGAYRLERPLGHGGFGEVWLAVHDGLRRKAALKLLRPDRLGERSLRRFEVERESLRLLAHPNVAKIYDAGTAPDATPFIAMEFIEGVPITQYCERMRLTIDERLALMATVCDAMHYVHLQGIIHRDLSPDNILVALSGPDEGQPKIIDFGIARSATPFVRLSEGTIGEGLGHVVGKLLYMSPEQAEAGPGGVDARTDVYALGVILYEMLAGVLPLDDDRLRASPFSQAVRSILETNRPAPGTRVRELDPEKRRALAEARRESDGEAVAKRLEGRVRFLPLTAMHVDRSRRFASASAMAEDIRNWLAGRDYVQAAEDPWWDRSWRHVVRHRVLWGAIAAALLALVAGVVGTTMGLQEARRSAAIAEDRLALSESVIALSHR
jgi:serine/threonine protein kinase